VAMRSVDVDRKGVEQLQLPTTHRHDPELASLPEAQADGVSGGQGRGIEGSEGGLLLLIMRLARQVRDWGGQHLRFGSYPRGVLLVFLKSRAAPWILRLMTVALFIGAALPDAGFQIRNRYGFLFGLGFLLLLTEVIRGLVTGSGLDAYRQAAISVGYLISDSAGRLNGASTHGHSGGAGSVDSVSILLRRAKDFIKESLKISAAEDITATLLFPERADGEIKALREVAHDDIQPSRKPERHPVNAPGIRRAYQEGHCCSIPWTAADEYFSSLAVSYQSVAYFPIFIGAPGGGGVVLAILALESTEPYRFKSSTVTMLSPFLSPIAQLIGLAVTIDPRRVQ